MTEETKALRDALHRVQYEAVSLADAQVIALEALKVQIPPNPWQEAVEDELVILNTSVPLNPRDAVKKLVAMECQIALDPDVSEQAANLVRKSITAVHMGVICLASDAAGYYPCSAEALAYQSGWRDAEAHHNITAKEQE